MEQKTRIISLAEAINSIVEENFFPILCYIDQLKVSNSDKLYQTHDILWALYKHGEHEIRKEAEKLENEIKIGRIKLVDPEKHSDEAPPAEASQKSQRKEPRNAPTTYTENLVDIINLGYSAVADMLVMMCLAPDSDHAESLAEKAMVLYHHAADREAEIIQKLEEKTGRIKVVLDNTTALGLHNNPIIDIVIEEASHE